MSAHNDALTPPVVGAVGDDDASTSRRPVLWIALAIVAIALAGAVAGIAVDRALMARRFADGPAGGPAMKGGPGGAFGGGGRHMGGPGGPGGPFGRGEPTDSMRKRMRARMAEELGLSAAQSAAVDSLMTAQAPKFRALRERVEPAMDSLVRETRASLDKILTPEQRVKADALRAEREKRGHGRWRP